MYDNIDDRRKRMKRLDLGDLTAGCCAWGPQNQVKIKPKFDQFRVVMHTEAGVAHRLPADLV